MLSESVKMLFVARPVIVKSVVFILLIAIELAFTIAEDTWAEFTVLELARPPSTVAAEIFEVLRRFVVIALIEARSVETALVFRVVIRA